LSAIRLVLISEGFLHDSRLEKPLTFNRRFLTVDQNDNLVEPFRHILWQYALR
jgi:hypothetical protein